MGSGCFSSSDYVSYSTSVGRTYLKDTGRVSGGQSYTATRLNEELNPYDKVRECCLSKEHPNPIPVILALDVTGSMGAACKETQESLGVIMGNLYKKYKDIEFAIAAIGDLRYDDAPFQISQYESDIRIAEALDRVWLEKGGGSNAYESYTLPWYYGLYNTELESYTKQGRKGIIITMGDEPMNPYLPCEPLNDALGCNEQSDVETKALYKKAKEKFDIYHIAVNSPHCRYSDYKEDIENSFGKLLDQGHLKVATINELSSAICECIDDSLSKSENFIASGGINVLNENESENTDTRIGW